MQKQSKQKLLKEFIRLLDIFLNYKLDEEERQKIFNMAKMQFLKYQNLIKEIESKKTPPKIQSIKKIQKPLTKLQELLKCFSDFQIDQSETNKQNLKINRIIYARQQEKKHLSIDHSSGERIANSYKRCYGGSLYEQN